MNFSVEKIAGMINAEVLGDKTIRISGVNSFEDAQNTDITFADSPRFINRIQDSSAGAIIIPGNISELPPLRPDCALLTVDGPKRAFFDLVTVFHPPDIIRPGIHPGACIADNVTIGKNVTIDSGVFVSKHVTIGDNVHLMPNVFVGVGTKIGNRTVIKPNVSIMEKTVIGSDVIIHSGSVIGSDGYGFTQDTGSHQKIMHTGIVEIGDHVEIGACNTIDRGTIGKTVIGNGVKTDNLVHIAHNVKIGDNTLIVAQVGIAGSATIGQNVIIAGKAAISGHLRIGDNTIIGPNAGIHASVAPNQIVSGFPQMPHKKWRKAASAFTRLPEMRSRILSYEKRIKELEEKLKASE